MVTRHLRHGHRASRQASINMATDENVTDTSWNRLDFFSGLVKLLDICVYHGLNLNLDFPSAAIFLGAAAAKIRTSPRMIANGISGMALSHWQKFKNFV